jgi:single-stranded-DNA-specific exonuclease
MKMKIKNIEKAAVRIKTAVGNNERIILYGDSDLDGISSVVIMEEAIKSLGGHVDFVFFPDRENDGYGINLKALKMLEDKTPALFITLDLGIGNIKEVDRANDIGLEVIIIDHHEPLTGVPKASIIVDPKQLDDDYPFKGLANVGVTFNLCMELLNSDKNNPISQNLENSFLELAALGTIADMVPQTEQNQEIIEKGLRSLKNTFRPALRAFLDILGDGSVFEGSLPKIISALNAAESVNFDNQSYHLLTCFDKQKCHETAQTLLDKNFYKQTQIKNIMQEVERRISQKPDAPVIFEGDPAWRVTMAGAVASIVCNKYGKPAFIYKRMDNESCGSVRNPKGTNSVDAMKTCANLLLTYGGHAQASGFRVKNENLEKFNDCLNKYFKK